MKWKISWNSETVHIEIKEQEGGFLSLLVGTLDARLIGNMSTGKGVIRDIDLKDLQSRIFDATLPFN